MRYPVRTIILAGAVLAAAGATGCSGGKSAQATPTTPGNTAAATAPSNGVAVTLSEFKVAASRTTVPAGHYSFTITNTGTIAHEMLVFHTDLAASALPMKDGDVDEEAPGVNKVSDGDNIDPGASQTRDVDLTTPGTYLLVCNIAGHFHAGMVQTITVT